jgi:hypothetical protein
MTMLGDLIESGHRTKRHGRDERGVALLLALFALLMLSAIGVGLIYMADTEGKINANYRDSQQAYFDARAGIEEARQRLVLDSSAVTKIAGPTALPTSAGANVLYIRNPKGTETVNPWSTGTYFDTELCHEGYYESNNPGRNIPCTYVPAGTVPSGQLFAAESPLHQTMNWKWVRITLKNNRSNAPYYVDGGSDGAGGGVSTSQPICWDGMKESVLSSSYSQCNGSGANLLPVYRLTALAVTPSGSRRMLQYEVVQEALSLVLPGALTIDGPIAAGASSICGSGSTCNSSGAYLSGGNPNSKGPSNVPACSSTNILPAIATADATSATNLASAISANKANIVGSGSNPSVQSAASSLAGLNTVSAVEALVAQLTSMADKNVGPDCTKLKLGTASSPTITVVTNAGGSTCNLNSGTTGYGILVLTGDLQYVNVNSYEGIILMLGTAQFTSTSSKDTVFTGSLFMAQDRDPNTGALLTGPGLGSPSFNFHHGNASATDPSIQYNDCLVSGLQQSLLTKPTLKVVAASELTY